MKRTLSIILILALTFSILPATVHAGGDVRTLWEENFNGPNAMRDWNVVDGNADGYSFTKYWPNQDGAYAASPLPSLGGGANGENSDEYLISPPIVLPDVTMEYELNFECQMVRAQGAKAGVKAFITAADVPFVAHQGLPLGSEPGNDHGGTTAQIGCVEHRAAQTVHAPDFGHLVMQCDVRTEAPEFRNLAEAVFKDCLPDDAVSLRLQQRRHQYRLGICGKAGIRLCTNVPDRMQFSARAQPYAAVLAHYITARLF